MDKTLWKMLQSKWKNMSTVLDGNEKCIEVNEKGSPLERQNTFGVKRASSSGGIDSGEAVAMDEGDRKRRMTGRQSTLLEFSPTK